MGRFQSRRRVTRSRRQRRRCTPMDATSGIQADHLRMSFVDETDRRRTAMSQLQYETLVLDGTPRAAGALPTGEPFATSPLTLTLIYGERDAVLVDAPYTYGQIERVRNWIVDSGKNL